MKKKMICYNRVIPICRNRLPICYNKLICYSSLMGLSICYKKKNQWFEITNYWINNKLISCYKEFETGDVCKTLMPPWICIIGWWIYIPNFISVCATSAKKMIGNCQ
jgi:hypothetical protein